MFLRPHQRSKDGKEHTYWSLVVTVRTSSGPRQRTLCYLGELNGWAQARWLKSLEVFNEQGEVQQLKLFPSHIEVPEDDPQVARVLVNRVRLERTRQFGDGFLGWELRKIDPTPGRLSRLDYFRIARDSGTRSSSIEINKMAWTSSFMRVRIWQQVTRCMRCDNVL